MILSLSKFEEKTMPARALCGVMGTLLIIQVAGLYMMQNAGIWADTSTLSFTPVAVTAAVFLGIFIWVASEHTAMAWVLLSVHMAVFSIFALCWAISCIRAMKFRYPQQSLFDYLTGIQLCLDAGVLAIMTIPRK
ncbi:hypothetical protein [Kluyvera sichuanensis]|uniref:hypothetical protein n=1 Tax=Kluyvera sichuanensis TaxID=2725494 RepID=UPI0039F5590A